MTTRTKKMDFSKIIESIMHLFEVGEYDDDPNFINFLAKQNRGSTQFVRFLDGGFERIVDGDDEDDVFYDWLGSNLWNFFAGFAHNFTTEDKLADAVKRDIHSAIKRKCKTKKFQSDLSFHIQRALYANDEPTSTAEGRYLVLKIITDYIHRLYSIQN